MTKQEWRNQMRSLRNAMKEEERQGKDEKIRDRLNYFSFFREAKNFYPFVSCGTEVDTTVLIKQLLQSREKRVAVPRVEGKEMEFYCISSFQELELGYMGILEPVTGKRAVLKEGMLLIPGLVFDTRGNRIGYGGGYYDRYLQKYPCEQVVRVAVAYDFQVVEEIEAEMYDQPVDAILTEKRTILVPNLDSRKKEKRD